MSISDLKKVGGCLTPFHSKHPLYLECLLQQYDFIIKNITTGSLEKNFRKLAAISLLMARTVKKSSSENSDLFMNSYRVWKKCAEIIHA